MKEKYYYCQFAIETDKEPCGNQCGHCKDYYAPLEQERKEEDLKEGGTETTDVVMPLGSVLRVINTLKNDTEYAWIVL